MDMEYTNPWHTPDGASQKVYRRFNCTTQKSKCGRGEIVKVFPRHHDYLVGGKAVSQRCGKNMELLDKFIAAIYEGAEFDYVVARAKACYEGQL